MADKNTDVLLDIEHLDITLFTDAGVLPAVQDLSLKLRRGETLAVVGESGCGKSMTALSIMGLHPQPPARITGGSINFAGTDISKLSKQEIQHYRGNRISMIFQEPMTSLDPVMTAGNQIREAILAHEKVSKEEAAERALEMIKLVGIPAPEKVYKSYPHELSGGMRQRIMIAMALACKPEMLICDEPTTALDVTIQAQVLKLIDDMRQELDTAVMLITPPLGVVSEMADYVLVMYAGKVVEYAPARELFFNPRHPYTAGLIASIPSLEDTKEELPVIPGNVPMLSELPKGCLFNPRCPYARDICREKCPHMAAADGGDFDDVQGHGVSCWKYTEDWGEQ